MTKKTITKIIAMRHFVERKICLYFSIFGQKSFFSKDGKLFALEKREIVNAFDFSKNLIVEDYVKLRCRKIISRVLK